jgi:cytochrome oxidase Cu insertion factor (SCO1/SenC/PrrC family)
MFPRWSIRALLCNKPAVRPDFVPAYQNNAAATPKTTARILKHDTRVPNFQFTLSQAGIVVACGLSVLGIVKMGEIAMEKRKRAGQNAIVSEEKIGKPKLGGPWTLYDSQTALPVTTEDLKGKYWMCYFGFTYCPDICPEELEKQKAVIEGVDKTLESEGLSGIVQPVFITVDPRRDTLAQTRMYVKEFHPRLMGLTGAPEHIKRVTRLFRVYYNEGIRTKNDEGEEDYLVDHSIIHYFMSPNNELVDFYGKNLTADEMISKIVAEIRQDFRAKSQSRRV